MGGKHSAVKCSVCLITEHNMMIYKVGFPRCLSHHMGKCRCVCKCVHQCECVFICLPNLNAHLDFYCADAFVYKSFLYYGFMGFNS